MGSTAFRNGVQEAQVLAMQRDGPAVEEDDEAAASPVDE